jgi:ribonuclease HI
MEFGEYYASLASPPSNSPQSHITPPPDLLEKAVPLNSPLSLQELKMALRQLKPTASGPDNIPPQFLQHLPLSSLTSLLELFNRSFDEGFIPTLWRHSILLPILKKDKSPGYLEHYRPISLTSQLGKLMERMILHRFSHFLESNNLLSSSQHGFRRGRSTMEALAALGDAIATAFEKRNMVAAVFFDFARAFDTVLPSYVLDCLISIGIHGRLLQYFRSFLSPRTFQVRIGSESSPSFLSHRGTPQGSILSPILFLLAIDGVTRLAPPPLQISLYADDLAVYVSVGDSAQARPLLQSFIDRLVEWSTTSGLHLTPSKCSTITFYKFRPAPAPLSLSIQDSPIPSTTTVRFLGLIWDRALTWSAHINQLRSSCFRRLNILQMTSGTQWGADRTCLLRFYRAYVRSLLDYGSPVYSSASPHILSRLDPVHSKGLRMALGAFKSSPVASLLAETPEPPLHLRRSLQTLKYTYRARSFLHNLHAPFILPHPKHADFLLRNHLPRPLSVRSRILLSDFSLPDCNPLPSPSLSVPLWSLSSPTFALQLSLLPKSSTPPVQFQQRFLELCSRFSEAAVYFTDGAKGEEGVGMGIAYGNKAVAAPLAPLSSIFTAEATALERALLLATRSPVPTILIASDSLSCLKALQNPRPNHPIILRVLMQIHYIQTSLNKRVVLAWCPGHTGIAGNERADVAAKSAMRRSHKQTYKDLAYQDLANAAQQAITTSFRDWWQNMDPASNKLRMVKTSPTPWNTSTQPFRRDEVVLARLRIGHTLHTHGHLMEGGPPPLCCGVPLSVLHFLIHCKHLQTIISEHFPLQNIQDILADNEQSINRLFRYLRRTYLYDSI